VILGNKIVNDCGNIDSVKVFIEQTKEDYKKWGIGESPWFPWFRGEPECNTPLVPKLYRKKYQDDYFENRLLQHFRMKAMIYGKTPLRNETDLWLFLAQHVGLPTRLLDWTGSSSIALYFALQEINNEKIPVVWMLNPFALNDLSLPEKQRKLYNVYGLTWYSPEDKNITNIANANIQAAWSNEEGAIELPVAIPPTYVHQRIPAQISCFTIHGKQKESMCKILSGKDILKKYVIDPNKSIEMLEDLRTLGVSRAALFPDLDGLARDLTELFRPDLAWPKMF
jgi:hypothetical protein